MLTLFKNNKSCSCCIYISQSIGVKSSPFIGIPFLCFIFGLFKILLFGYKSDQTKKHAFWKLFIIGDGLWVGWPACQPARISPGKKKPRRASG